MSENKYYIEYLQKTDLFPQSIYHKAKHEMVKNMVCGLSGNAVILDAGCGIGNITKKYCRTYSVIGIDEQLSAVQYCKDTCSGRYAQASLDNLPFADNTFDLVLFLDAIEHLQNPISALEELQRVLKIGAAILVCTMNYSNPLWFILEHTWHRFCGGTCKPYSKNVHPTQYTEKMLRQHCNGLFEEVRLQKRIMGMELFYIGKKGLPDK